MFDSVYIANFILNFLQHLISLNENQKIVSLDDTDNGKPFVWSNEELGEVLQLHRKYDNRASTISDAEAAHLISQAQGNIGKLLGEKDRLIKSKRRTL